MIELKNEKKLYKTSLMVDEETHHTIKTLAVEKRMKIGEFLKEVFSKEREINAKEKDN